MKKYEYKIYDSFGTRVATLADVTDTHPQFSYDINGGLGSLVVSVGRPRSELYCCTDLVPGNMVVVTEKTESRAVYSGRIVRVFTSVGGRGQSVKFEAVGHVSELSWRIFEDQDGDTGLMAFSKDPSEMFSDVIDLCGGIITKGTIETSGITASMSSNGSYSIDVIRNIMERLPNTWYWYVDAHNRAHLKKIHDKPDHILAIGREVENVQYASTIDHMVNEVMLVGGTPDAQQQIMVRSANALSQEHFGKRQKIITDGRITDTMSIQYIINSNMSTSVDVEIFFDVFDDEFSIRGYDIESIHPGDTIKIMDKKSISNATQWDVNYWDSAYWDTHPNEVFSSVFVVKRITYRGDHISVAVSNKLPNAGYDMDTIKRNFDAFVHQNIPIRKTVTL